MRVPKRLRRHRQPSKPPPADEPNRATMHRSDMRIETSATPGAAMKPESSRRPIRNLRWWIGGLLFFSTVINYVDRQTLSVLAPFLKEDYKWTNEDYALIVISFRIAYAIEQLTLASCGSIDPRHCG